MLKKGDKVRIRTVGEVLEGRIRGNGIIKDYDSKMLPYQNKIATIKDYETKTDSRSYTDWFEYTVEENGFTWSEDMLEKLIHMQTKGEYPYEDALVRVYKEQTDKGVAEYGHTLEGCDYSVLKLLKEAQKELVDGFAYVERAIRVLEQFVNVEEK